MMRVGRWIIGALSWFSFEPGKGGGCLVQIVGLSDSVGAQEPVGDLGEGGRVGDERAVRSGVSGRPRTP
jgi:hypothetical protein